MSGKRVKRSEKAVAVEKNIQNKNMEESIMESKNAVETIMEQVVVNNIDEIDKLDKRSLLSLLVQYGHNEKDMEGASITMLQTLARSQYALLVCYTREGRTKKETKSPFSKRARIVQRFLEDTKSTHHMIMKHLIDRPQTSGKEINHKFGIKYGQTCVHHARVMINVLYNQGLLSQECVKRIDLIKDELE